MLLAFNPSCISPDNKNKTIEVILSRKSVRNFIPGRAIHPVDIEAILRAGMAAPSGKDIRPWELLVIDDREILAAMAEDLPTAKMLAQAPLAIIVCGDVNKSFYWYLDCAAVTQNILLACESLGLGAVWTASYPYEERMEIVARYTHLPEHILPLAVIPIGYPEGKHTAKNKFDPNRIRYNKWEYESDQL